MAAGHPVFELYSNGSVSVVPTAQFAALLDDEPFASAKTGRKKVVARGAVHGQRATSLLTLPIPGRARGSAARTGTAAGPRGPA